MGAPLLAPLSDPLARQHGYPSASALRRALHRAARTDADGIVRAQLGVLLALKIGSRWRLVQLSDSALRGSQPEASTP